MSLLAKNDRQLIYIYSDESDLGKKMLAYADSVKKSIRTININKENITGTIWLEIADMLDKPIHELFSTKPLSDIEDISEYNTDDILKLIDKNPSLLQKPIAIVGEKAEIIDERFDFFEFYSADGSNFDKSPEAIKNGEHVDTTNDKMNNSIGSIE